MDHEGYNRLLKSMIGAWVRSNRESKGLSQLELEVGAGLAQGVVCRIELGRVIPTLETLLKLSSYLGVTLTIEYGPNGLKVFSKS